MFVISNYLLLNNENDEFITNSNTNKNCLNLGNLQNFIYYYLLDLIWHEIELYYPVNNYEKTKEAETNLQINFRNKLKIFLIQCNAM